MRIVPTVLCLLAGSTAALADIVPTLWGVQMSGNAGASTPSTGELNNSFSSGSASSAGFLEQPGYTNFTGSTSSGTLLDPAQDVLYDFSAKSSISGTVSLGEITAAASNDAAGLHVVKCGLALCGIDSSTASSSLNAHWFDTLALGGLASGTPEDFLVTSSFVASLIGATYPAVNGAEAAYSLSFSLGHCDVSLEVNETTPNVNNVQTCVLQVLSGQVLRVDGQLSLSSLGTTLYGLGFSGSSTVDVFDPQFLLDPITPGATYSSASGTNYESSAVVPEPDTLGLTILGGLALAHIAHRRASGVVRARTVECAKSGPRTKSIHSELDAEPSAVYIVSKRIIRSAT